MNFEMYLSQVLQDVQPSKVKEAMQYSLMNGGKRIRPLLLFEALKGYGIDEKLGYSCAAGIEMIHTYSLIHDDLPAMDNDTLRRGKPTCHIAFDEATAILAGDGLLTQAFLQAANACENSRKNLEIVKNFVSCAGCDGMIYGQILDIEAETKENMRIQDLERIHAYKTGKLLTLPLLCAAILAGADGDLAIWEQVGEKIGLSFQIQDDLLDVTSTSEELGKNVNSDQANHKATYATLMDMDEAKRLYETCYREARNLVEQLSFDTSGLFQLLEQLKDRKK